MLLESISLFSTMARARTSLGPSSEWPKESQQLRTLARHEREVNAMLTKLAQSFVILTALAAAGLVTTCASAAKLKDSGSADMAYVKHCGQAIPDQDGHMFVFQEGEGTSTNKGGLVDGFSVRVREITDLRKGTGAQRGYVIYSKGSDQRVDRIDGMVHHDPEGWTAKDHLRGQMGHGQWNGRSCGQLRARAPMPVTSPQTIDSMSIGKALARSLKVLPRNPKSKQNRERGHPGGPSSRNVGYRQKRTSILTFRMSAYRHKADTAQHAERVMAERVGFDPWYGYPYNGFEF